jgi:hypothetical protein
MEQTIALIDLFEKNFVIPHYQRGYRWEVQEVDELLNDLWSFEKTSNKGEFYCLQPIVIQQKENNIYHVLDGQQRLTTLYLIVTFLDEIRSDAGYNQSLFSLDYETRADCNNFLKEKRFVSEIDETNIDYFHICKAFEAIKKWFSDPKHAGAKMKLVPVLMDKNDKANRNLRFIWYEIDNNVNPIEIFIRLNVGKIPLTDAELTKALLLQSDKYDENELKFIEGRLFELASEWDTIEYTLQTNEFWSFLCNQNNGKPTHIEFIFDLIADRLLLDKNYFEKKPIKHATFLILSEYLQDLIENENLTRIQAVGKIWELVTEYFEYFREWFQNRTLYHYIGYLITLKGNHIIDSLIIKSKTLPKKQFIGFLEKEIGRIILVNKERKDTDGNEYRVTLEKLNYENEDQKTNDRPEILKILLLHNLYASLKSDKEQARFPFNLYKKTKRIEKWSLEHIHAQNSRTINKKENQLTWLHDHIQSLRNQNNPVFEKTIKRMNALKKLNEIEQEAFDNIVADVYSAIKQASNIDESKTHSISNLCLVDANTNSKLNNSVFDVKREKIKERELNGHYIPICTRNVFMKAYTSFPISNAYWTDSDRDGYLDSIKHTYDYFVNSLKTN